MPYTYNQTYEVYEKGTYVTTFVGHCPVHPAAANDEGPYSITDHHYQTGNNIITCFTKDAVIQLISESSDIMYVWYNPKTVEKYVAKDLIETASSKAYYVDDPKHGMYAQLFERKYIWSKQVDATPYILSVCIQDKKLKKQLHDAKNCSCMIKSMSVYNKYVFDLYLNECVEECMAKYEEQKAASEMHLNIHALPYVPHTNVQRPITPPNNHKLILLKRSDKKKKPFVKVLPTIKEHPVVAKEQPIVAKGPLTVVKQQPIVAKEPQPIVAKQQPVVTNQPQPIVAKPQPIVAKGPPVVVKQQPIVAKGPTTDKPPIQSLFGTPYIYNKETIKEYHSMITKTMRKCRRN
jgi:hypothetical protein